MRHPSKDLELSVSLPAPEMEAIVDNDIIRKIMVNLMSNALKYAASMIELSLKESDGHIVICVSNDGPRIPEGQKEKIFQIFYQIPDDKKQMPGTGIGPAFSKSLAESHQGHSVRREPAVERMFVHPLTTPEESYGKNFRKRESHPESEGFEPDLPQTK